MPGTSPLIETATTPLLASDVSGSTAEMLTTLADVKYAAPTDTASGIANKPLSTQQPSGLTIALREYQEAQGNLTLNNEQVVQFFNQWRREGLDLVDQKFYGPTILYKTLTLQNFGLEAGIAEKLAALIKANQITCLTMHVFSIDEAAEDVFEAVGNNTSLVKLGVQPCDAFNTPQGARKALRAAWQTKSGAYSGAVKELSNALSSNITLKTLELQLRSIYKYYYDADSSSDWYFFTKMLCVNKGITALKVNFPVSTTVTGGPTMEKSCQSALIVALTINTSIKVVTFFDCKEPAAQTLAAFINDRPDVAVTPPLNLTPNDEAIIAGMVVLVAMNEDEKQCDNSYYVKNQFPAFLSRLQKKVETIVARYPLQNNPALVLLTTYQQRLNNSPFPQCHATATRLELYQEQVLRPLARGEISKTVDCLKMVCCGIATAIACCGLFCLKSCFENDPERLKLEYCDPVAATRLARHSYLRNAELQSTIEENRKPQTHQPNRQ